MRPSAKAGIVAGQLRRLAAMSEEDFVKQGFPSRVQQSEFQNRKNKTLDFFILYYKVT